MRCFMGVLTAAIVLTAGTAAGSGRPPQTNIHDQVQKVRCVCGPYGCSCGPRYWPGYRYRNYGFGSLRPSTQYRYRPHGSGRY
jgi:hypothetical protein